MMKVILSKKGMDTTFGRIPNPILPDGTLLSLPIPDPSVDVRYADLYYKGQSLLDIIKQLSPRSKFDESATCHLDPDIFDGIKGRPEQGAWMPAFGQAAQAAAHLDSQEVGEGDVFLFYGRFRKTEHVEGKGLRFVPKDPVRQIIYGYMKVKEKLDRPEDIERYPWHPHCKNPERPNNRLYVPSEYGTFKLNETDENNKNSDSLVLTLKGQNKMTLWKLEKFFANEKMKISWQGGRRAELKDGYASLKVSPFGQEIVVSTDDADLQKQLVGWANGLIALAADTR